MKVMFFKDYRPEDIKGVEQPQIDAGIVADIPDDEAKRAIDLGIAATVEDALRDPTETEAITLLTALGYGVTPPKTAKK